MRLTNGFVLRSILPMNSGLRIASENQPVAAESSTEQTPQTSNVSSGSNNGSELQFAVARGQESPPISDEALNPPADSKSLFQRVEAPYERFQTELTNYDAAADEEKRQQQISVGLDPNDSSDGMTESEQRDQVDSHLTGGTDVPVPHGDGNAGSDTENESKVYPAKDPNVDYDSITSPTTDAETDEDSGPPPPVGPDPGPSPSPDPSPSPSPAPSPTQTQGTESTDDPGDDEGDDGGDN